MLFRSAPRKSATPLIGGVLIILVAAGAAFWGIQTRARTLTVVTKETNESTVPIVAVTSWEEVLDLTEAELRALYCEVRSRPPGAATMAYWSVRLGLEVTTNG